MKAEHKDHIWCWDFVFDRTMNGSTLKWLSIVDEFTRECLILKVNRGITSENVIDNLAELFAMRGVPKCIRSDNGPEFISKSIQRWLKQLSIDPLYIQPGSPWENGYAENFHSRFRDEFLGMEEFESLHSAKKLTKEWKDDYNENRPHGSLGYLTPSEYARRCAASVSAPPLLQLHSGLKGLCANFDAKKATEAAYRVETTSRSGELSNISKEIDILEQCIQKLFNALSEWKADNS